MRSKFVLQMYHGLSCHWSSRDVAEAFSFEFRVLSADGVC